MSEWQSMMIPIRLKCSRFTIEPLHLECKDFANAIRTGVQPRAHGGAGVEVVRILAQVQKVLEEQETRLSIVPNLQFV